MKSFSLILTATALFLASCGGTPTPSAKAVTSVSGTVVEPTSETGTLTTGPWSGGAGTITGTIDATPNATYTPEVVMSAPLAADGTFTLSLPASVDSTKLRRLDNTTLSIKSLFDGYTGGQATCTGGTPASGSVGSTSPLIRAVGTVSSDLTVMTSTTTGTDKDSTAIDQQGGLLYVDGPITISTSASCSGSVDRPNLTGTISGIGKVTLTLAKGWNEVNLKATTRTVVAPDSTVSITLTVEATSGALPGNKWVTRGLMPTTQSLAPLGGVFGR